MMMKYIVTVSYTFQKELAVYAKDDAEAEDKATDIVLKWNGVVTAEAIDCRDADA